jgi:hypothetical protein
MGIFRPGTRVKYSDGVIYRVAPNGAYLREDGGKPGKAALKAAKKQRIALRQTPRRQDGAGKGENG